MIDFSLLVYSLWAIGLFLGIVNAFYFAVMKYCRSTSNAVETSVYSVIVSITYLASAGAVLSLIPVEYRRFLAYLLVIFPIAFGAIKLFAGRQGWILSFIQSRDFLYIGSTVLFSVALVSIASFRLPLPESLPDGAYVNKEHVSAVRIQYLTGNLPADNVVPYVVQEYLANDISFLDNNPILPGQQVTNRPILVSLVSLPIRLALRPIESLQNLATYSYVGTDWPDFRVLVRDELTFFSFLGVGVILNASLLLGVGLFARQLPQLTYRLDVLLIALFVSSPYFIFQTLFTWPKSLAGFLILTAAYVYFKNKNTVVAGGLIGLAYLSHPYAVGYLAAAFFLLLINPYESTKIRLLKVVKLLLPFLLVVLPWFFWKNFIVNLDSNLISQNFSLGGVSVYQFGWTRVANIMNTVFPTHLLGHGNDFTSMFSSSSVNLMGAAGTIFVLSVGSSRLIPVKNIGVGCHSSELEQHAIETLRVTLLFLAISSILLSAVFSNPAVPLVHGWQPLVALIFVLGTYWISRSARIIERLSWIQVFVNALTFVLYYLGLWIVND